MNRRPNLVGLALLTAALVLACEEESSGGSTPVVAQDTSSDDTVPDTPCGTYCHLVETHCTGDNAIEFEVDCATDCATWTEGEEGEEDGNTTQCRVFHAIASELLPEYHCPHAAPDGGGVCVDVELTLCDIYCQTQEMYCNDENAIEFAIDCLTDCATWPAGYEGDTDDNSVHCRIFHAELAETDAAIHCPHASPDGGGKCED